MPGTTTTERALLDARPRAIDHTRPEQLHYLGNYLRRLPVSLTRMMENAYDWEHLPHVHASSFNDIELVDSGPWGWRARALPAGAQEHQLLELLVDAPRHYWATTIVAGPGAGVEIHTQASAVAEGGIEVDVRFYSQQAVAEPERALAHDYLSQQYALLYDEDLDLMAGRQAALDERNRLRDAEAQGSEVLLGEAAALASAGISTVQAGGESYCVRYLEGAWTVHPATCPHLLGPLNRPLDAHGHIVCPWHGYRFDPVSGENLDGKCRALSMPAKVSERDGRLYVVRSP